MSKSIRLSEKHGVNPCIPVCVFCGKPKNEIALLGRLKNDAEAPGEAILDYQPCEECLDNWSQGVALIKVTTVPPANGLPPLTEREGKKLYPTGQYCVITTDAAKRIFDMDADPGSRVFMDAEAFDRFMDDAKAGGAVDENGEAEHEAD